MHSACMARLIRDYSWLKLQSIVYSQIDSNNCLKWGQDISQEEYYNDIQSVHPIHKRLLEEPECIIGELYYSFIKSLIINFTSTLEYFLKDSLKLNMMRNYSLFKKVLSETKAVIDPKDIVDIDNIDKLRYKYIINISEHVCIGELWKTKFKKYIRLLELPKNLINEEINNRIDIIWQARNDIAHANTKSLVLDYNGKSYTFHSNTNKEGYTELALLIIRLADDTITFLSKIDELSLDKWKATDATLLYKSII